MFAVMRALPVTNQPGISEKGDLNGACSISNGRARIFNSGDIHLNGTGICFDSGAAKNNRRVGILQRAERIFSSSVGIIQSSVRNFVGGWINFYSSPLEFNRSDCNFNRFASKTEGQAFFTRFASQSATDPYRVVRASCLQWEASCLAHP